MAVRKKKKDEEMAVSTPYTKGTFLVQVIMTVLAVLFIAPLVIILNYSFKTKKELYLNSPLSLPDSLNFDNYIKAFNKLNMKETFFNTFFYTAISVLILAVLCGLRHGQLPGAKRNFSSLHLSILL